MVGLELFTGPQVGTEGVTGTTFTQGSPGTLSCLEGGEGGLLHPTRGGSQAASWLGTLSKGDQSSCMRTL